MFAKSTYITVHIIAEGYMIKLLLLGKEQVFKKDTSKIKNSYLFKGKLLISFPADRKDPQCYFPHISDMLSHYWLSYTDKEALSH